MARSIRGGGLCLALLLAAGAARAQDPAPDPDPQGRLEENLFPAEVVPQVEEPPQPPAPARDVRLGYRPWVDGPITGVIWAGWLGTEALKSRLGPQECTWCEPGSLDGSVRDSLVWSEPAGPRMASDLMLYGVAPVAALVTSFGLAYADDRAHEALWDVLLILEAGGAAAATTQTVKFFVARQRPYAFDAHRRGELFEEEVDDNLSFFSGHTSFTFGLAAATATVAKMRGRRYGWVAWAVGLPVAALTGYLRIAGDKHYLSDVAVGAAVGLATGILVPAVHDWDALLGRGASVAVLPMPGGAAGTLAFAW